MAESTHKPRVPSPYGARSSKAANHSKGNTYDPTTTEFYRLYHPQYLPFVSTGPVHAESRGKDGHHTSAREPLERGNMGPLTEESSSEANGLGHAHSTPPPIPTPILTLTPTSTCAQPSNHEGRDSYDQATTVQPPTHPPQERNKNHVGDRRHNNNTYPHSPSAQHTPKTLVSLSSTSLASDATYTQSSSPHQSHDPSPPVYPPTIDFRKPQQQTQYHTRFHSLSPPPNDKVESRWGTKNPTTPPTTSVYSPLPSSSSSNLQEELHARLVNSVPAYDASYPRGYPHMPWRESFEPNSFRNNLYAAFDLNELEVAPWCGTDLVGNPTMFSSQPGQARADDARHKRVSTWSLEEQQMRTQWHPQRYLRQPTTTRVQSMRAGGTGGGQEKVRGGGGSSGQGGRLRHQGQGQGGYADYGLLDQSDEVRATAKWAYEIEESSGEEGGEDGGEPILVPIRNTSARLVDMVVSKEVAEEEALFLPPVRDKYVNTAEKKEGFWHFLRRTIDVETGMTGDKDKEKKK
ncbi:hypothetical protein BGZ82_007467 [Podila clonocystis]|nr:hypothetical protein BGZ82_007467 [Podila clonocystis]